MNPFVFLCSWNITPSLSSSFADGGLLLSSDFTVTLWIDDAPSIYFIKNNSF